MLIAVYVDVLLVVNFIINYLLLRVASSIVGMDGKWWRIYLAATIGSLASMIIFLPSISNVSMNLYKLVVTLLMVSVAFGYKNFPCLLAQTAILFTVSFIFCGAIMAIYLISPQDKILIYNGVVYFDITAITLLAALVIGYSATLLVSRVLRAKNPSEQICDVTILAFGKMFSLKGLIDTGNNLTEPFSGLPVIVVSIKTISKFLPEHLKEPTVYAGIRIIPYNTIGGSGVLTGFKPDLVRLSSKMLDVTVKDVYIGLATEDISSSQYDAIVNPILIG